jgi:raffinose/stachyose/melibiose transport system permease protein
MKHLNSRYPLYFLIPALAVYLVFVIYPSVVGIGYAFTDWNAYRKDVNFIGLENFERIFSPDEFYLFFLQNTLIFTFLTIVLKTVIALALALLLNGTIKRMVHFYRVIIFLPAILPTLIVALIFRSILHPSRGILNEFLRTIGLDILAQRWLVDPAIALYAIVGVDTWKGIGYIMVILLAGLQTIPRDYYEAAEIDGANAWQRLRFITIPMLMPAITVVTVLNVLHGLRVFDIVYALTNGGPGYATEVMYTVIFKAFSQGQFGLGTAVSTVLLFILLIAGYFVIRLLERSRSSDTTR